MGRYKMRKISSKNTFTKVMVKIILTVAIIDLQLTYILAFIGKPETLQETSGKLITEILGVVLVYCVKSFFETREEEKNKLIQSKPLTMGDITGFDDAEVLDKDMEYDTDFAYSFINCNRDNFRN